MIVRWGDPKWGYFAGHVVTEWVHENGQDRRMVLQEPFAFVDASGVRWDAPEGRFVDGASIPRLLWWLVDPFVGDYRFASVVHDIACQDRTRTWQETHLAFYHAMLCAGVGKIKAWAMYQAVYRFGPRW